MTTFGNAASRRYGIALALITGIVATGCGSDAGSSDDGGSTAGSSASSPEAGGSNEPKAADDACDLVSDDVAVQVLGVKIVRREAHGEPGGPSVSCLKGLKRTSNPKGFTYVNASVVAGGASAAEEAAGQEGAKPVSGLGDRAIFLSDAGALFIIDGNDLVQVQVVKGGVPGSQQEVTTVAKDVLSNRD